MDKWLTRFGAMLLAVVVLSVTGCPPKESEEPKEGPPPVDSQPPAVPEVAETPAEKPPIPIKVPETLKTLEPTLTSIPEVKLPQTLKETCLVAVGDALPAGEILTLDGEKKAMADLLGEKGTVVFFWGVGGSEIAEKRAVQALADLEGDAHVPYGGQGLAVIAIAPNAPPEESTEGRATVNDISATIVSRLEMSKRVKQLLGKVELGYPVMLDPGGAYFGKVANKKLPRVYVLDGAGKIVWFDVEFSEVSRETLKAVLKVLFGAPQPAQN